MRKLLNKIIIFSLTCCLVGCSTQVSSQSTSTSETSSSSMTTTSTSSSSKASSSSRVILPSSSSALPPNEIGVTLLSEPYRTKYYSSDKLSLDGGQIRVCSTIENCKTLDMEGNVSVVKSLDSSKNGTQEITLKYNDNKFTKTFSYDITMEVINQNEKGPTSLVTGEPVELNQQVYMDNYNYSSYDFRDANEWLKHLNFNSYDTFPSSQYLPEGYDPETIMEWGQTPVLGISSLHERGITGYGVNIAYIDQRLRTSHEIIKDANITYYDLQKDLQQYVPSNPNRVASGYSMHGISVASLIVGKGVGAAPEVNLHFFGTPEMMLDQRGHATAIYKVLEVNKTLPQAEKIRVIGFSDNPDNSELNIEAFQEAVRVANSEGILVLFADNMRYDIRAMDDRDNPGSYRILGNTYDKVGFPTSYTLGGRVSDDYYTFWSSGGTSWTTPVEISLVAMALQVYPQIDVFKIEDLMRETAYHVDGSLLINPVGFITRVEELAKEVEKPYYYAVVYNGEKTDDNDLKAIKTMGELMDNEDTEVRYYDAKTGSAADILQTLMDDYNSKYQQLIGVQIIGTYAEVPAFIIKDKVDMGGTYGIHDAGLIYTDHFYANFKNSPKMINTSLSMYSTFSSPMANNYSVDTEELGLNLYPEWPVARLLLKEGQIDDYLFKYLDYLSLVKNEKNTLVNFSNPIFANSVHKDDFGYFISKTLSKKQIVNDYRLYGNEKGMYPVTTSVLGDFTKENLALENEKGIMNLVINTHGQEGNIDRAYYTTSNSDSEQRESFANNSNINSALATNYYNLYQWTCWGAANLNDKSIIYTMLSEGKAINVIGSSYLFSNNGMDVYESYPSLLGSNPISLFYTSMEGIYQNNVSWGESLYQAKNTYIRYTLADKIVSGEGNYQFNLNNAIMAHYFGLLDSDIHYGNQDKYLAYYDSASKTIESLVIKSGIAGSSTNQPSGNSDNVKGKDLHLNQCAALPIGEKYNVLSYFQSQQNSAKEDQRIKVNSITVQALKDGCVKIEVNITNGIATRYSVFNPPNGSVFMYSSSLTSNASQDFSFTISKDTLTKIDAMTIMFTGEDFTDAERPALYLTNGGITKLLTISATVNS